MSIGLSPSAINVEAFLRQSLFGALPLAALKKLAAHAQVEAFHINTKVNCVGQVLQHLRLVIEGGINITAVHSSGREVLVGTIGPGAWASWMPCFEQRPLATDYVAVEGSLAIALPMKVVRKCFEDYPHLYPLVLKEVAKRLRSLMEWVTQSALLPPTQRLARLLTLLARERNLSVSNAAVIPVTRAHLATLIGCSRQSAGKLFAQLERLGLIKMGYGKCEIPDLISLRKFSE